MPIVIISYFFGKSATVCEKLNVLNKPINTFNMDETGVTTVHTGGKVVTRKNVWSITSGEKGKTHKILACVFVSGFVLPRFLIYPRQRVTENLKSIEDTTLAWLNFFAQSIPPSRPVLLVLDGHSSRVYLNSQEATKFTYF